MPVRIEDLSFAELKALRQMLISRINYACDATVKAPLKAKVAALDAEVDRRCNEMFK